MALLVALVGRYEEMKSPTHLVLLSFNGGYVDTLGFLALSGLFTAHVTGNFVTLGATVAVGLGDALPKLLALPVFCMIVFTARLFSLRLEDAGINPIRPLLLINLTLLCVVAIGVLYHGPIRPGENGVTLAVGLMLVAAMAVQNGLHRAYLTKTPPTTLMTGTTTQILIDVADMVVRTNAESVAAAKMRVRKMVVAVLSFASGCAIGAAGYIFAPAAAFCVPVILAAIALLAGVEDN